MPTTRLNFTRRALDALPCPAAGRAVYKDDGGPQSVRELYLHVGTGSRVFFFTKKVDGRTVRYRLGEFPAVSIESARKRATKLAAGAADGIDPNEAKRERRHKGVTFGEAFDQYIGDATERARKPLRPTTVANYRRSVSRHFARWLAKPLEDIGDEDVARWYKRASAQSPTSANAALRVARAVVNHQAALSKRQRTGLFQSNPFAEVDPVEERARTACVESAELPAWFEAVATLGSETTRDYLHVLLFTGLRRREAAALRWSDVNLRRRTLTVTDTKNGEPLTLPLSTYLHELLTRRQRTADDGAEWVFPSTGASGHIEEVKTATRRVAELTGIEASPHALRRTFSNVAQFRARVPLPVVKRFLNHAIDARDVTARHYTSMPFEDLRPFMQEVTDALLESARQAPPAAEVVALRAVG